MKKFIVFVSAVLSAAGLNSQVITTIAGTGTSGFSGDSGAAVSAELHYPYRIAKDLSGNIYFSDMQNNRIRKIDASGIISTLAGNGTAGFSGDNGPALSAELNSPSGIAVDATGTVYFTDYNNNRVRKISTGGIISTVAGTNVQGYSGDGNSAGLAELNGPRGIAIDAAGNLYIADSGNNRVRKISANGIIYTVAGNGNAGFSGDGGQAMFAELAYPKGIAIDNAGNLFIADCNNQRIRKVTPAGIISTVAGNGNSGPPVNGILATNSNFDLPSDVATDNNGNIFIDDYFNGCIRKVDASGIITTIAGGGTSTADNITATTADLHYPMGICLDNSGNLMIAEAHRNRLRKVTAVTSINNIPGYDFQLIVFPNPSGGIFTIPAGEFLPGSKIEICSVEGKIIYNAEIISDQQVINLSTEANGIYLLSIISKEGIIISRTRLIKE
jgi:sugar lactone lactonase YvrE